MSSAPASVGRASGRAGLAAWREPRLAVALAVFAAAALRLPLLSHQSLWFDEVFTRSIAMQPDFGGLWDAVRATESTPPLFYAVEWVLVHITGSGSDAVLRFAPALAGVLTVPLAYAAIRPLAGRGVAVAAAWLCAVSPLLVWYSLEARAYALFVLVGMASIWTLTRVLERPSGARLAAWAAAAATALWTHYYAAFLLAAEIGVLLVGLPAARRRVLAACLAIAAAVAPLVPLLADQRDTRASFIEHLPVYARLKQTVRQFAMGPNVPAAWLEASGLALLGGALAVGLVLAARRRQVGLLTLAVLAGVTVVVPAGLLVLGVDRHFFMRNVLVAWPCMAAVAAAGLLRLRGAPLVLYLVLTLVTIIWVQADWRYGKPDWEIAAQSMARSVDSEPLVIEPGFEALAANRYLHRVQVAGPVRTAGVWVAIVPSRGTHRALDTSPVYPRAGVPGFVLDRTVRLPHGFLLVHFKAPAPRSLALGALGPDLIGQSPAILVPQPAR